MTAEKGKRDREQPEWLLFFYTVPAKPVSARMKVWRKLMKHGALQLKGAVYILPFSEETHEFLLWLVSEISAMRGEGSFVRTDRVETMEDQEIIDLFNQQREAEYMSLGKELDVIEQRLMSMEKGSGGVDEKQFRDRIARVHDAVSVIARRDYFCSRTGAETAERTEALKKRMQGLTDRVPPGEIAAVVLQRRLEDYQGRVWVTRKRPFVDRMASAWLISTFVDSRPEFRFSDGGRTGNIPGTAVFFDMPGGEFTHVGDLCTFEVLMKAFGLKNRGLQRIAEIVHELDVKDGKCRVPQAQGIEDVLAGIRKTARKDGDMLRRGMEVFGMLYASLS